MIKWTLTLFVLFISSEFYGQTNTNEVYSEIGQENGKYYLMDFSGDSISSGYDSISKDMNYYFAFKKNRIDVYSKIDAKLIFKQIRAVHLVNNTSNIYQVIKDNNLYWVDENHKLLNKNPNKYEQVGICGSVDYNYSQIEVTKDSTFYINKQSDLRIDNKSLEIINITTLFKNSTITFLNKLSNLKYDENNFYKDNLDNFTLIETTENKKINIVKLYFKDGVPRKKVLLEQVDKLFLSISGTQSITFSPFQFQKNGLLGYYPCNKTAKYLFLNPIDENFARFILVSGKKGWLGINGNEYLDE
jgi:hypothetical protein